MKDNKFYKALRTRLQSKIDEGTATLQLYLTNPSAVADHSALVDEMEKILSSISEAEDSLEKLEKYFGENI